jgi:hypothetical protein
MTDEKSKGSGSLADDGEAGDGLKRFSENRARKGSKSILPSFAKKTDGSEKEKKDKKEKKKNRISRHFGRGTDAASNLSKAISAQEILKEGEDDRIVADPENANFANRSPSPIGVTAEKEEIDRDDEKVSSKPGSPRSPLWISEYRKRKEKNGRPVTYDQIISTIDDDREPSEEENDSNEKSVILSEHMRATQECMGYLAANMMKTSATATVDQEKIKHLEGMVFVLERELAESKSREKGLTKLLESFEIGINKVYNENLAAAKKENAKLHSKIMQLEHNNEDLVKDYGELAKQLKALQLSEKTKSKTTNGYKRSARPEALRSSSANQLVGGRFEMSAIVPGSEGSSGDPKLVMKEQTEKMLATLAIVKAFQGPATTPELSDWWSCYGKDSKTTNGKKIAKPPTPPADGSSDTNGEKKDGPSSTGDQSSSTSGKNKTKPVDDGRENRSGDESFDPSSSSKKK